MKNPEVDTWLKAYDNPMKPVVQATRELILNADSRIGETIKWQAPTFEYKVIWQVSSRRRKNTHRLCFTKVP